MSEWSSCILFLGDIVLVTLERIRDLPVLRCQSRVPHDVARMHISVLRGPVGLRAHCVVCASDERREAFRILVPIPLIGLLGVEFFLLLLLFVLAFGP